MKKIIVAFMLVFVLSAVPVSAQTVSTTMDVQKMQLLLQLLEQVNQLQKQLDILLAQQGTLPKTDDYSKIVELFYQEFEYETCTLNPYQNAGFTTKSNCQKAISCMADSFASLIPVKDRPALVAEMKRHGGEGPAVRYMDNNPVVEQKFRESVTICSIR